MTSTLNNIYDLLEISRNNFLNDLDETDKKLFLNDKHQLLSDISNNYAWYLMGSPKKAGFYQYYHVSSLYPIWKWANYQIDEKKYNKENVINKIAEEFEEGNYEQLECLDNWDGTCKFISEASGCYLYDGY